MEGKNIVRVQKNRDYTVINNTSIRDTRLSWKAKAIHVFMLSKPDDWTFYNEEMQQWAKDGKDSFTAGLRELQKYGYVKKERRRVEGGKFDYVTIVYEVPYMDLPHTEIPSSVEPYTGKPLTEKPSTDKPFTENPQLLSTDIPSTDSLNTDNNQVLKEREESRSVNPFLEIKNCFDSIIRISNFTDQRKMDKLLELYPDYLLIIEAIKLTADLGKSSIEYVEGILRNWAIEKGINSYPDWLAKEAKRNASHPGSVGKGKSEVPSIIGRRSSLD